MRDYKICNSLEEELLNFEENTVQMRNVDGLLRYVPLLLCQDLVQIKMRNL